MTLPQWFASNAEEFDRIHAAANELVYLRAELPSWPFKATGGLVDACDFSWCLDERFQPVLDSLARIHGDETVSVLDVLSGKNLKRFVRGAGHFPAFTLPVPEVPGNYFDALTYEPDGLAAQVMYADTFVLFGSSGRWAIWGEYGWDLAILHSDAGPPSWRDHGVPFLDPEEAVELALGVPKETRDELVEVLKNRGT
jgi:hypothetical protein